MTPDVDWGSCACALLELTAALPACVQPVSLSCQARFERSAHAALGHPVHLARGSLGTLFQLAHGTTSQGGPLMLSDEDFDAWALGLSLTDEAKAVITRIRASQPVRRVTNRAGNMCGVFASRKMGHNIQWESWTGERALVLLWEEDDACLEVWDQALTPPINYVLPSGKRSGARTTIDFMVLTRTWVGGVDYKTSSELRRLAVEKPYRWVQTGPESWDQPPAREALQRVGLGYHLLTDCNIPHLLLRNVDFLRSRHFFDVDIPQGAAHSLTVRLKDVRRLQLIEAIALVGDPSIVYEGHFRGHWYLALQNEPLALPDNAWVYVDRTTYSMFQSLERSRMPLFLDSVDPDDLPKGSILGWAGQTYQLLNRTEAEVFLFANGHPLVPMRQEDFRRLVRSREITTNWPVRAATAEGLEILKCATAGALDEAITRLKALDAVRAGKKTSDLGVARRTIYVWQALYDAAEVSYSNGFIGLIPRHDQKGNRTSRTGPDEIAFMRKSFEWMRGKVPRETKAGYSHYMASCKKDAVEPRSFASFNNAWHSQDQYEATKDRAGKRAAYPLQAPRRTGGDHLGQGPVEGDSPFAMVHIDHLNSNTFSRRLNSEQLLGKPWFTIAIDAYTRYVLGLWVSIMAPSHAAVMMVLRDIIRRHGRLPMTTITDGGSDFKAERVARFLSSYGCDHAFRPASEPRYGNPVERTNLDVDHHLTRVVQGSNEVLKNPRMSSASHDPRHLAYLTVPRLTEYLEHLFFDLYPHKPHAGLQSTPEEKWRSAALLQGTSWGRPVSCNEEVVFRTLALPHKHGGLMRQRDGIRLNGHNYYSDALIGHDGETLRDRPLYDPEDPTYIYVRLDKRWTQFNMIDSQLRRLPPPDQRRHYLSERIFLARPSTSKDKTRAFLESMGQTYSAIDAEREALRVVADNDEIPGGVGEITREAEADQAIASSRPGDREAPPNPATLPLVAAPISRRRRDK